MALENGAAGPDAPPDLPKFGSSDIKGMLGALRRNLALKIEMTRQATRNLSKDVGLLHQEIVHTFFGGSSFGDKHGNHEG